MKKSLPYILILVGLLIQILVGIAPAAGICILLGIVMFIERMWPEKWEPENP